MSRLLSELLAAEEPLFSMAIKQMEQASGNNSVDVRLTAEIVGKVHMKMRALGLDPRDTNGQELYHALLGLIERHDAFLARRIGIDDPIDVQQALPRIGEAVQALDIPKKAWVLKTSAAKRLLKKCPPKSVMKHLGYRSIDSMIKRESIYEIYGVMRILESSEWVEKFVKKYKDIKPTDFETRNIEFLFLDQKKWGEVAVKYVRESRHNITHLKELGLIVILPLPPVRMPGVTITVLSLLLHYVNEIRLYSSFFKAQQVHSNFSTVLINTLIYDSGKHASIAGQHIHWRVIHRHFGSSDIAHPEAFEPHIEPEDLIWRKTEETLYRLEPALHFWHDMEYVGVMIGSRPVSFNIMDAAVSYVNALPYGKQSVHYMQNSIWNEIYLRYMGQKATEQHVLKQLQNTLTGDDVITVGLRGEA